MTRLARRLGCLALLLGIGCIEIGCRTRPIIEPAATVPPGLTIEQVKDAILTASARRGWQASMREPGKIQASINVRGKHSAEVEIDYDSNRYTIRYLTSENLMHSEDGEIHKAYNGWVIKLDRTIRQELFRSVRRVD